MFSLVLFGGTRLATSAVSDTRWSVGGSRMEEGERPPSASLLWSSGRQAAAPPQRSTSSRAPLDPPSSSLASKSSSSKTGQSWLSPPTHGISNEGGGACHRSTLLSCRSSPLPPISQFFDTKITLAGRCNSHISGIFASVLFIFLKRSFDFIFFNVLYCYFCLHAVVYENTGC